MIFLECIFAANVVFGNLLGNLRRTIPQERLQLGFLVVLEVPVLNSLQASCADDLTEFDRTYAILLAGLICGIVVSFKF